MAAGVGTAPRPALILASRSPQRKAILEQLGVAFSIAVPEVEELAGGPPEEVVVENACRKAQAIAARAPDALVLGVDTVVFSGDRIYGKPEDPEQARATLLALSGTRHTVISGVCLIGGGSGARGGRTAVAQGEAGGGGGPGARTAVARTSVRFRLLSDTLLRWYLDSNEWRDRAGAYAIQGRGAALVAAIDGDYLNVVGLPVTALLELEPGLLGFRAD